jgi:hypothetical protein
VIAKLAGSIIFQVNTCVVTTQYLPTTDLIALVSLSSMLSAAVIEIKCPLSDLIYD